MTFDKPDQVPHWAVQLVRVLFFMALGYIGNQFITIPIQQERQDARIFTLEKVLAETKARVDANTLILNTLVAEHKGMMEQQKIMQHKLDEETELLLEHARKSAQRNGKP